jgi:uncharacterized protein
MQKKKALPEFKYHPYPIDTANIIESNSDCPCCNEKTGYSYIGPVHSEEEIEDICPWCIKNGDAHKAFNAEFVDRESIGHFGLWQDAPSDVKDEIAFRTPGFEGLQQEYWWTHCGDAAAFIGYLDHRDKDLFTEQFIDMLAKHHDVDKELVIELIPYFDKNESPRLYLFECLHCEQFGGYFDFDLGLTDVSKMPRKLLRLSNMPEEFINRFMY